MNRCPHPADVCDFAHVIMSPITPTSTDSFASICRYYYSGTCMNGALCKFQHGTEVPHTKPIDLVAPAECVVDWPMPSEPAYPDSPPLYGSYLPYGQGWPTSPYALNGSFPRPADSILFAPPRSRDSIDTTSTSTSSLDSDDLVVVTHDPKYEEHSHSHQSQVCVADDAPVIHVPPLHPLLYANTTGTHTPNSSYDYIYMPGLGMRHSGPSKSRTGGSKSSLKQKALKYKTKPCKFFNTEKGCPSGSACTFLHDETVSGAQALAAQRLAATRLTAAKEEVRKNFVPIPWRVIGGGVLVGKKKDDSLDEKSSDSDHPYSSHILPSKPAPLKIITRQRSNSIPPTPSVAQVKIEHLFSAESPGVL